MLCLDEEEPKTVDEMALNMLCGSSRVVDGSTQQGSATNRWYDKLQLVVCNNGVAGVNFEHSMVDGHTALRFASDIFTDTILRFAQSIRGGIQSVYRSPSTGGRGAGNDRDNSADWGEGQIPLLPLPICQLLCEAPVVSPARALP